MIQQVFNIRYFRLIYIICFLFFCQCHHMSLMDFVVSSPSFGRGVADFLGWDVRDAQLRCPDEVDGDI
jgi:hypothetical protein